MFLAYFFICVLPSGGTLSAFTAPGGVCRRLPFRFLRLHPLLRLHEYGFLHTPRDLSAPGKAAKKELMGTDYTLVPQLVLGLQVPLLLLFYPF